MRKLRLKVSVIIFIATIISNSFGNEGVNQLDKSYFSDESGNVFMQINIIGHVKNPGTVIVPDSADILTAISQAGGPLQGAKLDNIIIYRKGEPSTNINLQEMLDSGNLFDFTLHPNDTIYLKQNAVSFLFSRNLLTSFLQILNISLTISKN